MEINRDMRRLLLQKLRTELGDDLEERTIGVLGLAFKPNTDDLREAAAIEIIHLLQGGGARVRAYDPAAMAAAAAQLPGVELCHDAYDVAQGADALIVATEWSEFRRLDLVRIRDSMRQPLVVDGRNIYDPHEMAALGFTYHCVGRPRADASPALDDAPVASAT
jgi:UDPglucose 6-dehydrogenase